MQTHFFRSIISEAHTPCLPFYKNISTISKTLRLKFKTQNERFKIQNSKFIDWKLSLKTKICGSSISMVRTFNLKLPEPKYNLTNVNQTKSFVRAYSEPSKDQFQKTEFGDKNTPKNDLNSANVEFFAKNELATAELAQLLANFAEKGDVFCLYGPIGAGKTFFSRFFIRSFIEDENLIISSPTFLLKNVYSDHDNTEIHHFDLYRAYDFPKLDKLNLDHSFENAICLIEWPENLREKLPPNRLDVKFDLNLLDFDDQIKVKSNHESINEDIIENENQNRRVIALIGHGNRWINFINKLKDHYGY